MYEWLATACNIDPSPFKCHPTHSMVFLHRSGRLACRRCGTDANAVRALRSQCRLPDEPVVLHEEADMSDLELVDEV